ncbi:hypothetical protein EDB84DRAFT_1508087 [Lactarius hengduanensis]|nr:hypothetical protein EDB84DRAFT_1508087 [Lactarius hengduanensis]
MAALQHLLCVLYMLAQSRTSSFKRHAVIMAANRSCAVGDPLVREGGQVLRTKCGRASVADAPYQYRRTARNRNSD